MTLALLLAPALVLNDRWDDERLRELRDSPVLIAAGLLGAAVFLSAIAALIVRRPESLALFAIAALPFRVPIEAGGDSANLLLPLYAVIAAGVAAEVWKMLTRPSGKRPAPSDSKALRYLPWALAAYVVLYALQGIHSADFSKAVENLGFFLVPFAVLAALLARIEWRPRLLGFALAILVAEAALFALIGFAEYGLRELLWNPTIIEANEVHSYFRVNSLFWDPNILGRYLMVTIVAVLALMLWERRPERALRAGAIALLLLAGLTVTFSQSSLAGLLTGLAVLAGLRWSARWTAAVCLGVIAAVIAAVLLSGGVDLSEKALENESSGRAGLVRGGVELAGDAPIAGHGTGSFEVTYGERFVSGGEDKAIVSHTEPVTVLAEQGAIGFIVYVATVVLALVALTVGIRRYAPGMRGGGGALLDGGATTNAATARAALLAALAAMIVHSLSYAAFFTDPITWMLLAIGLALAAGDRR
ncbi:MAG: O-antigen ligase family protein [Solirubrobacterales bacterium]